MSRIKERRFSKLSHPKSYTSAATGSQRLILGFALIIFVGTVLLRLPIASTGAPVSWLDALFTSTSAVTVTGLTVFSTANTYSLFGQWVILLLLQVGGIGFIAISVVLYRLVGRSIGMQDRFLLKQSLGVDESSNILRLTIYVIGIVVGLEVMGAFLLFVRWSDTMPIPTAAYRALFHAASSFCNAGFDLFAGTSEPVLFGYGRDPWSLGVLALLILIGGFGLPVVDDLLRWPRARLSVHTKIILVATLFLTLFGGIVLIVDEHISGGLLSVLPLDDQIYVGFFTIISARTAGVTILPLEQLSEASKLILIIWMFIGGGPSSMAGGVTTNTVAVLALAMLATVRGQPQAVAFGRAIPFETVMKAMAVMTVSTLLVAGMTLLLSLLHIDNLLVSGFEVVSAFSNTGYSLGLTGHLTPAGKIIISFVMFWGRLGPLTLVVVLAQRQRPSLITYPDEKLSLGVASLSL